MKKINVNQLARKHIVELKPYSSARDEYTGKLGVFLDANENPWGSVLDTDYNRYPDPLQFAVKERLADIKSLDPSQIFLGNGSDEAIDLLFRIFCEPTKDHVILMPPTYGMYQVSADINQVSFKSISLTKDFQIDLSLLIGAIEPTSKLIFICSPNNPTGNCIKRSDIIETLEASKGLVVVR